MSDATDPPNAPDSANSAGQTPHPQPGDKQLRVVIDLERLRLNLAREDGQEWTQADVVRWLSAQFAFDGTHWLVRERDLGQLDPVEVISVEDVC